MMGNDTYVEHMIKRRTPLGLLMLRNAIIALTVLAGVFLIFTYFFIVVVAIGAAEYFVFRRWNLEYEYIYQNGDMTIDKIMSRSTRKRIFSLSINDMEVMYKGRNNPDGDRYNNAKRRDYTSNTGDDNVYTMILTTGGVITKMHFEPNEEIVNAIRMIAPRKVK